MRVMVLGKANQATEAGAMPSEEMWKEMEQFNQELIDAGIVVCGEGLMPSSKGVRIRRSGSDRIVTRGPFAETSEVVAGYSIWEVESLDEAIAWAKRCPMAPDAEMEIRPIFCYTADEVSEIVSQT